MNETRQPESGFYVSDFSSSVDARNVPATPVGALMDFCRTSKLEDRRTFTSLAIKKGRAAVEQLLVNLRAQRKSGQLKGIQNLPAYVTKSLSDLPDSEV